MSSTSAFFIFEVTQCLKILQNIQSQTLTLMGAHNNTEITEKMFAQFFKHLISHPLGWDNSH